MKILVNSGILSYAPPRAEELPLQTAEFFLQSGTTEPILEDPTPYTW